MSSPQCRRVFLVRHGERCDLNYGYNKWISMCFNENGDYVRADLNMPRSLPKRSKGKDGFRLDSPLTQVGTFQATLTGEGLADLKYNVKHAIAAPALRCIQTCDAILSAMKLKEKIPINIEPGFFEYLGWYKEVEIPDWMTYDELIDHGFNINRKYKASFARENLSLEEHVDFFYERNYKILKYFLECTQAEGGDILLVGHSSTLEVCSRQMVGQEPRTYEQMFCLVQDVPYLALVTIKEKTAHDDDDGAGKWEFEEINLPNFCHSRREPFNWEILVSDELLSKSINKNKHKTLSDF